MIRKITKFIYLGVAAWIYSIIVQSPFAYFVWHFTFDQYIAWVFSGLLITLIFFGALIRIYLNWYNALYDRVFDNKKKE